MYSIWSFLLQNEVECMPSSVHVLTAKTHPLERPCLPRYTRLFSSGTCQKQNWISSPYVALSGEGKHGASLLPQYSANFLRTLLRSLVIAVPPSDVITSAVADLACLICRILLRMHFCSDFTTDCSSHS